MTKTITIALLAGLLASPALWCADAPSEASEKKLSEHDVPAAVLKTMQDAAAGAKLGEYESETKQGISVFTATFHDKDGVEQEVTVTPDGKLIGVSKEDDGDDKKGSKDDKK